MNPLDETTAVPRPEMGTPPDAARVQSTFLELCEVVARLRSPTGCPWDREQTLATIKPHTLEETYELLEAIDSNDNSAICEELGDVLLQVLLDSQIAADEARFDVIDVINGLTKKLIDRHPHVFGDATAATAHDVLRNWDRIKQQEKKRESLFDGLPVALPALARAARITEKAAKVGFDFPNRWMLFDKLREELAELAVELAPGGQVPQVAASAEGPRVPDEPIADAALRSRVESELGDVLFVIANICRRWKIDPEEALRATNSKFERRVRFIEDSLKSAGRELRSASMTEMEELYQSCKQNEQKP